MKYYKQDSRKISFREYFNISPTGFPIAWLYKLFGIPMNLPGGIPAPQPFRDNIIDPSEVPAPFLAKFNTGMLELRQLGFDQFWFYTLKGSLMGGRAYGVVALHTEHKATGKIIQSQFRHKESFLYVFGSELAGGQNFFTTNSRPQFKVPSGHILQRNTKARAGILWEMHQKKLARLTNDQPPRLIANLDQLAAFEERLIRISFDYKVAHGIWVEMTDAEVAALRAKRLPPLPTQMS